MKVVDFFSGCGGTSYGFRQAGMDIIAGIDIDQDAALTFRYNFPEAQFLNEDIRNIHVSNLRDLLTQKSEPVLFSGCAPCQPFSNQNRNKHDDDQRINLLSEFWRFIDFWKPEYVFVENVPGLQKPTQESPFSMFVNNLKTAGYQVTYNVIASAHFGVPQIRKRLVILASKTTTIHFPTPSHGLDINRPISTVAQWIRDLPVLQAGATHPDDPDHQAAKLSKINLERIRLTPEGGSRKNWPEFLRINSHKNYKGHADVYGRLSWDKPAATLTTKCTSYSNGRFGHPEQDRALSVREAACLQTFPRNYRFFGSLQSKARQVGNAVPPLVAKSFGQHILRANNFRKN